MLTPFPEVELVHHVPVKGHPLGRYVRERRRIELSCTELFNHPPEERLFAVYHELGHWWRTEHVGDEISAGHRDEMASRTISGVVISYSEADAPIGSRRCSRISRASLRSLPRPARRASTSASSS